jgi:prepilin-type N-terminal cleavage/methylation domain-containing protein
MKKIVRRRGFTLPEVLVTVTVIAVLAAVVVPAVTQYVSRGNGPATQTDISALQNAITGFITDTRAVPHYLSDLTSTSAPSYMGVGGAYHGPYLNATVSTQAGPTGNGLGGSGVQSGVAAFTSAGEGIAFADTVIQANGKLQLLVLSPLTCTALQSIDAAIDDGSATTGNFVYGSGSYPFSGACTGSATGALLTVSLIGQ